MHEHTTALSDRADTSMTDYTNNASSAYAGNAQLTTAQKNCPLLALPGEVRNMIYGFCMGDRHSVLPVGSYDPRYTPLSRLMHPPSSLNASCLGLMHTCRELRDEFRPLYMNETTIEIPLDNLEAFLRSFYPRAEPQIMKTYCGNLRILAQDCYFWFPTREANRLFQLLAVAPRLRVSIERLVLVRTPSEEYENYVSWGAAAAFHDLLRFTSDSRNTVWHGILQNCVRSIKISLGHQDGILIFEMKDKKTACEAGTLWTEAGLPTLKNFWIEFQWRSIDMEESRMILCTG